jgi:hypothetical protein
MNDALKAGDVSTAEDVALRLLTFAGGTLLPSEAAEAQRLYQLLPNLIGSLSPSVQATAAMWIREAMAFCPSDVAKTQIAASLDKMRAATDKGVRPGGRVSPNTWVTQMHADRLAGARGTAFAEAIAALGKIGLLGATTPRQRDFLRLVLAQRLMHAPYREAVRVFLTTNMDEKGRHGGHAVLAELLVSARLTAHPYPAGDDMGEAPLLSRLEFGSYMRLCIARWRAGVDRDSWSALAEGVLRAAPPQGLEADSDEHREIVAALENLRATKGAGNKAWAGQMLDRIKARALEVG